MKDSLVESPRAAFNNYVKDSLQYSCQESLKDSFRVHFRIPSKFALRMPEDSFKASHEDSLKESS